MSNWNIAILILNGMANWLLISRNITVCSSLKESNPVQLASYSILVLAKWPFCSFLLRFKLSKIGKGLCWSVNYQVPCKPWEKRHSIQYTVGQNHKFSYVHKSWNYPILNWLWITISGIILKYPKLFYLNAI